MADEQKKMPDEKNQGDETSKTSIEEEEGDLTRLEYENHGKCMF